MDIGQYFTYGKIPSIEDIHPRTLSVEWVNIDSILITKLVLRVSEEEPNWQWRGVTSQMRATHSWILRKCPSLSIIRTEQRLLIKSIIPWQWVFFFFTSRYAHVSSAMHSTHRQQNGMHNAETRAATEGRFRIVYSWISVWFHLRRVWRNGGTGGKH
jgi:hypothetical protein